MRRLVSRRRVNSGTRSESSPVVESGVAEEEWASTVIMADAMVHVIVDRWFQGLELTL